MVVTQTSAERLAIARTAAGYATAKEFARAHDIPQSTYALHESGKRAMRPKIAEAYASFLGNCDAAWLLYGQGTEPIHVDTEVEQKSGLLTELDPASLEVRETFSLVYDEMLTFWPEVQMSMTRWGMRSVMVSSQDPLKSCAELAVHIVLSTLKKQVPEDPNSSFRSTCLSIAQDFKRSQQIGLALFRRVTKNDTRPVPRSLVRELKRASKPPRSADGVLAESENTDQEDG